MQHRTSGPCVAAVHATDRREGCFRGTRVGPRLRRREKVRGVEEESNQGGTGVTFSITLTGGL